MILEAEGISLHIGGMPMSPFSLCVGDAETVTEKGGIPGFNSGLNDGVELGDGVMDGMKWMEIVGAVAEVGEHEPDVLAVIAPFIDARATNDGVDVPELFLPL